MRSPPDRSADYGDEDPLVELARIVSEDGGFYKPRTRRRLEEESAAAATAPALPGPEEEDAFAPELESELLREFERSHGLVRGSDRREPQPPAFGEDVEERPPHSAVPLSAAGAALDAGGEADVDDIAFSDEAPGDDDGRDAHDRHDEHHHAYSEDGDPGAETSWPRHPLQPSDEEPADSPGEPIEQDFRDLGLRASRMDDLDPLDAEVDFTDDTYFADDNAPVPSPSVQYGRADADGDFAGRGGEHRDHGRQGDEHYFDEPPPQGGADQGFAAGQRPVSVRDDWDTVPGAVEDDAGGSAPDDWPDDGGLTEPERVRPRADHGHETGHDFAVGGEPLFTIERPGELDTDETDRPLASGPLFDSAAAPEPGSDRTYLDDDELFEDEIVEAPPLRGRERPRFGPADFEPPERSRASLLAIAAVLAVAIIGGVVAATIGLTSGPSDADEPPVIRADNSATKLKPTEVAAADDSEGDGSGVFDTSDGAPKGEEKLVDRIEEPRDVARIMLPDADIDAGGLGIDDGVSGKIEARMTDGDGAEDDGPRYDPIGPRKVKTVIVRPDGTIVQRPSTPEPGDTDDALVRSADDARSLLGSLDGEGEGAADGPRPVRVLTVDVNGSDAPVSPGTEIEGDGLGDLGSELTTAMLEDPQDTEPELTDTEANAVANSELLPLSAIPKPKPSEIPDVEVSEPEPVRQAVRRQPAPAREGDGERPVDLLAAAPATGDSTGRASPAVSAPTSASGYVVQVSAQRSQDAAESTFRDLQRRFPSLLGGHDASIQRAEIAGKGTYYRVRVGPWSAKADADALCEQLKASGGACFVAR